MIPMRGIQMQTFDEINLKMKIYGSVEWDLDLRLVEHGNYWNQRPVLIDDSNVLLEDQTMIWKAGLIQYDGNPRFRCDGKGQTCKISTPILKQVSEWKTKYQWITKFILEKWRVNCFK